MNINANAVQTGAPTAAKSSQLDQHKLREACHDFEALFMAQMLKVMRQTTAGEAGGLALNEGNPLQDMFDWELAKSLSERSPLGVSEAVMRSLSLHDHADTEAPGHPDAPAGLVNRPSPRIESIIERAASRHRLDPELIRAVITCESGGDRRAESPRGAKGLMQLMDSTVTEMGVSDPFDPRANIYGGTAYLRQLLDRYSGNMEHALAAYNAGPAAVDRWDGIPPYPETQRYVRDVLSIYHSRGSRGSTHTQAGRNSLPVITAEGAGKSPPLTP